MAKKDPHIKNTVLFVCAANQCRSPMAMVLFRDFVTRRKVKPNNWWIESAGVRAVSGYPASDFAIRAMKDIGLDLNDHHSQPVTESLLDEFNLILCMEREQKTFLRRNFPDAKEKILLISEIAGGTNDIWDPVGHALATYQETAKEMLVLFERGFNKILELSE